MNNEPNIESAENLGGLKSIKRIPGMLKHAPDIAWGPLYQALPVEARLHKAEKLASAMNHAADVLQTERNKVIEIAHTQETQIQKLNQQAQDQNELTQNLVATSNKEKQKLSEAIVDVQRELRVAERKIRIMEKQIAG